MTPGVADVLACFETPHDSPPDFLIVLTTYMDESAHDTDRPVLAGFLGNKKQWTMFASKWRKRLGKRPGLHMSSIRKWDRRTETLLGALAPVPFECGLKPLCAEVKVSDYKDLILGPNAGGQAGLLGEVLGDGMELTQEPTVRT